MHPGDTPDMLDARAAVLDAGHLDLVTDAVTDVGAGTAHHLAAVRRALGPRRAVAIDASVAAARRAARADPEWITAVVADAWAAWPLLDRVAAGVLSIFAPRNMAEAARVLLPSGASPRAARARRPGGTAAGRGARHDRGARHAVRAAALTAATCPTTMGRRSQTGSST